MKITITADDFGICEDTNEAIINSANYGILTDTCIMANGAAFDDAIKKLSENKINLRIGIHLHLFDENHNFSFLKTFINSFNKNFRSEIEKEFRLQIEKVINAGINPKCINSHVHIHAIPLIFELTCKLAKEYQIPTIRIQKEKIYYTKDFKRHLNFKYPINIIKNIILNTFTYINKNTLKRYELSSNDYLIGILYTGNMDKMTIESGINTLPEDCNIEVILHPSVNEEKKSNYIEYKTLMDENLKYFIHSKTT